mmetsp:Transcript_48203/g.153861  ORF Transcript_48203/g.153861 Transcript_48203/m.153861 type:complete len:244 (+) Transcript_48203:90-821(+)
MSLGPASCRCCAAPLPLVACLASSSTDGKHAGDQAAHHHFSSQPPCCWSHQSPGGACAIGVGVEARAKAGDAAPPPAAKAEAARLPRMPVASRAPLRAACSVLPVCRARLTMRTCRPPRTCSNSRPSEVLSSSTSPLSLARGPIHVSPVATASMSTDGRLARTKSLKTRRTSSMSSLFFLRSSSVGCLKGVSVRLYLPAVVVSKLMPSRWRRSKTMGSSCTTPMEPMTAKGEQTMRSAVQAMR